MGTKKPHRADDRRRGKNKSDGIDEDNSGANGMGSHRVANLFNDRRYSNGQGKKRAS